MVTISPPLGGFYNYNEKRDHGMRHQTPHDSYRCKEHSHPFRNLLACLKMQKTRRHHAVACTLTIINKEVIDYPS